MSEDLRQFALAILGHNNGISTVAWEKLNDFLQATGEFELLGELASQVTATDGRFYIKTSS